MDKGKFILINIEGGMKMLREGGAEILRVCSEVWKIGQVKGEGVKSGNKTKGLITSAELARFAEISAS